MVLTQAEHEKYNATHYPGTRQMCIKCGEPTDRCEEDAIYTDDGMGPLCPACYDHIADTGKMVMTLDGEKKE